MLRIASDVAIKAGMTSASALHHFWNNGAEIYSFEGLHTKMLIADQRAIIGSANLSENAGVNTCEASLLTDDLQVVALVQSFIEQLRVKSTRVDNNFLTRIGKIPVVRTGKFSNHKPRPIGVNTSRLWLVSTRPLGTKTSEREAPFAKIGEKEAAKKLNKKKFSIDFIRWSGHSRFRSEAKPGNLVIQVFNEKRGKRTFTEVYRAAPILHRQDEENWTRFYFEEQDVCYSWSEFRSDLIRLGFKKITKNSTRELTEKDSAVLASMPVR